MVCRVRMDAQQRPLSEPGKTGWSNNSVDEISCKIPDGATKKEASAAPFRSFCQTAPSVFYDAPLNVSVLYRATAGAQDNQVLLNIPDRNTT